MTKNEALRLALDALKATMTTHGTREAIYESELLAIQACEKALAQPKEWVGLTNDEVNNFAAGCHLGKSVQAAIYNAEAKLKEKNT